MAAFLSHPPASFAVLRFQIEINNIHRVAHLFYPPDPTRTRYR